MCYRSIMALSRTCCPATLASAVTNPQSRVFHVTAAAAAGDITASTDQSSARRRLRRSSRASVAISEDSTSAVLNLATLSATAAPANLSNGPQKVNSASQTTELSGFRPSGSTSTEVPRKRSSSSSNSSRASNRVHGTYVMVPQPLPRVLILHTGGTLGMDLKESELQLGFC